MKPQHRLEAVVIHLRNMGDSHRVVELCARQFGRVSALARGARASKRRFRGALDLFVKLQVDLVEGKDLWTLQSAQILDARVGIRTGLERMERAHLICECARRLLPEHSEADDAHEAVQRALDHISRGEEHRAVEVYPVLLAVAGVFPERAPGTEAFWSGGPCASSEEAAIVEKWCVDYIQRHLGSRLKSDGALTGGR